MKIDNFIHEGIHDPNIFKAIFTAGGPGSGKSFIVEKLLGGKGMKSVDLDSLFVYMLGKENIGLDPASIASDKAQNLRRRAKDLTKKRKSLFTK